MMSLFNYTGKKDSDGTGLKLNAYAKLRKQPFHQRELDFGNKKFKVFLYSEEFLDEFFTIKKIFDSKSL